MGISHGWEGPWAPPRLGPLEWTEEKAEPAAWPSFRNKESRQVGRLFFNQIKGDSYNNFRARPSLRGICYHTPGCAGQAGERGRKKEQGHLNIRKEKNCVFLCVCACTWVHARVGTWAVRPCTPLWRAVRPRCALLGESPMARHPVCRTGNWGVALGLCKGNIP